MATNKRKQEFEKAMKTLMKQGAGLLEIRVYTGENFLHMLVHDGDDRGHDLEAVAKMIAQWGRGADIACWICGGNLDFPTAVVILTGHCDDPTRAITGAICTQCHDTNENMVRRATDVLDSYGIVNRRFTVHPDKGHA